MINSSWFEKQMPPLMGALASPIPSPLFSLAQAVFKGSTDRIVGIPCISADLPLLYSFLSGYRKVSFLSFFFLKKDTYIYTHIDVDHF